MSKSDWCIDSPPGIHRVPFCSTGTGITFVTKVLGVRHEFNHVVPIASSLGVVKGLLEKTALMLGMARYQVIGCAGHEPLLCHSRVKWRLLTLPLGDLFITGVSNRLAASHPTSLFSVSGRILCSESY